MKFPEFAASLSNISDVPMRELQETMRHIRSQVSSIEDPGLEESFSTKSGPGGGMDMESFNSAFFLIGLMVGGGRKELSTRVWDAWHIEVEGSVLAGWGSNFEPTYKLCAQTRQMMFGQAVRYALEHDEVAAKVKEIRLWSHLCLAEIDFGQHGVTRFCKQTTAISPRIYTVSHFEGQVFSSIQNELKY